MATVRLENSTSLTKTERTYADLLCSDTLDIGGLALTGIQLSTSFVPSLIAFSGSMSSTTSIVPIHNAIGGRISLGSTSSMAGKMIVLDPPMFAGLRYLQVSTITSTGGTVAQSTSDTIKLCVTDRR